MKRILSVTLVCVLIFNSICSIYAAPEETTINSDKMLVEIEQERNLMYQDLVTQLEAQGALDKIDYFTYLIDDSINAKYFSARSNRAGEKPYMRLMVGGTRAITPTSRWKLGIIAFSQRLQLDNNVTNVF